VSGVVFGGTLERMLMKLSLIQAPPLTTQQRQLPIARNVAMAGAVVGVIIGCALGATTLLLVDLEARDRIQRAVQLREIVNDMIADAAASGSNGNTKSDGNTTAAAATAGGGFQSCTSCTVYIEDDSHDITLTDLSSSSSSSSSSTSDDNTKNKNSNNNESLTTLKLMKQADTEIVRQCAENRRVDLSSDRHLLFAPVMKRKAGNAVTDGEVMAVVAASSSGEFNEQDLVTAQVMARHIAIFLDRLAD